MGMVITPVAISAADARKMEYPDKALLAVSDEIRACFDHYIYCVRARTCFRGLSASDWWSKAEHLKIQADILQAEIEERSTI